MERNTRKELHARRLGNEVVFEKNDKEFYAVLDVENLGVYVAPKTIIYTRNDGWQAIEYSVLQQSAIKLQENGSEVDPFVKTTQRGA